MYLIAYKSVLSCSPSKLKCSSDYMALYSVLTEFLTENVMIVSDLLLQSYASVRLCLANLPDINGIFTNEDPKKLTKNRCEILILFQRMYTNQCRPSKSYFIHIRMACQHAAECSAACNHIEHTGRQTGLSTYLR